MRLTRLILFVFTLTLAGTALAQNLVEVAHKSAGSGRHHAARVITNDDIPATVSAVEEKTALQTAPVAASAENPETQELCRYVTGLRKELLQLDRRAQKLRDELQKTDSDMLRQVYVNAIMRLTETHTAKEEELREAQQTPEGASCRPLPGTAPGATPAAEVVENR